jgi:hypothetical protein
VSLTYSVFGNKVYELFISQCRTTLIQHIKPPISDLRNGRIRFGQRSAFKKNLKI